MKFSNFMFEWLYGKDGYYEKFKDIGKKGDFYTSVSVSQFFGGSIANRLIQNIDEGFLSENCVVLEVGAHQGYLISDIVRFIYTLRPKLLKKMRFATLEPLENIRKIQKDFISKSFGDEIDFEIYSDFKDISFEEGFIVANEIFDSFPCEVIKNNQMLYANSDFEVYFDAIDKDTREILKQYPLKKGELALNYDKFAKDIDNSFAKFEFVTFDYGDKEPRGDFSLRVYSKHKVYPFFSLTDFARDETLHSDINLKNLFKTSDLTYDVDFNRLIKSFEKNGIKLHYFASQMKALVDFEIAKLLEILKENVSQDIYLKEVSKIKHLIDPSFLGERFKCSIFRKN